MYVSVLFWFCFATFNKFSIQIRSTKQQTFFANRNISSTNKISFKILFINTVNYIQSSNETSGLLLLTSVFPVQSNSPSST